MSIDSLIFLQNTLYFKGKGVSAKTLYGIYQIHLPYKIIISDYFSHVTILDCFVERRWISN